MDDLKNAKEVLNALGLKSTAKIVEALEKDVDNRVGIPWSKIQNFLDTFEMEAQKHSKTCKETFELMEKILLTALDDSKTRTRLEFQKRALNAPPIDPHIDILSASMPILNEEIKYATRTKTGVLLIMFGHIVRWQALEDFAKEWVGHWGKGLSEDLKSTGIEFLLTIKFGTQTPEMRADTRLYRNAIAHGHFGFIDEHHVEFWTRDDHGKKHELPSLNSGDILELYNLLEIRLRTMEAFGRVLRAWGRHPSKI